MINYDRIIIFVLVLDFLYKLVERLLNKLMDVMDPFLAYSVFVEQRYSQFIPGIVWEPDLYQRDLPYN